MNPSNTATSGDHCPGCTMPLYGETECSWCAHLAAHRSKMGALTDAKGKLTVRLASIGNPDFGQDACHSLPGVPRLTVRVATLRAASEICRVYIEHHNLGGGNWIGGEVKRGKVVVARISYNGRAWAAGDKRHELPLDGEV